MRETKEAASLVLTEVHKEYIFNFFRGGLSITLAYMHKEETQEVFVWNVRSLLINVNPPKVVPCRPWRVNTPPKASYNQRTCLAGTGGNRAQYLIWFSLKIIRRLSSVPKTLPEFTWVCWITNGLCLIIIPAWTCLSWVISVFTKEKLV